MRHTTRALALVAAVVPASMLGMAAPASANMGNCAGRTSYVERPYINAYVGHRVQATFRMCYVKDTPTFKVWVAGTLTPVVTLPSRIPLGAGETVKLIEKPFDVTGTKWEHVYSFSVENGPVAAPWARQTFDFDIKLNHVGESRICFRVGKRTCGPIA